MAGQDQHIVPLGPFRGIESTQMTDLAIQGTPMRGGFNVELRDGEWWTRQGERKVVTNIGGVPWWWLMDINARLSVIANAYYALSFNTTDGSVQELYTAAVTENVTFTSGSSTATSTTLRSANQLVLVGVGETTSVYRVTAASGAGPFSITLDRNYSGTSSTKSCRFIDSLARNVAGTTQTVSANSLRVGSAVVFEQLVTNAATGVHAASPATTAGHSYLVITSRYGVPTAVDLTAFLAGAKVGALRLFFYNTALGTPAQIGSDSTTYTSLPARGLYASVYKNRLFIAYAADPNGNYGDRTVWYSQIGDLCRWHTGISGQTAAPNYKTFDGEGDEIAEMLPMAEQLVVHRWKSQEIGSSTQSPQQPFTFRSNRQNIGIHNPLYMTNSVVSLGPIHFFWSRRGIAMFDGGSVRIVARDAYRSLVNGAALDGGDVGVVPVHDERTRRIYWFFTSGNMGHQSALPASANYSHCFVHNYETDAGWWEYRPTMYGGGMITWASEIGGVVPQALISRRDGTIVELCGRKRFLDADFSSPSSVEADVYAQVDTPWMSFGTMERKQLRRVEVLLRTLESPANFDWDEPGGVSSGARWVRLRVFADWEEVTAQGDVGVTFDTTDTDLDTQVDYLSPTTFMVTFTPRASGRVFKLRFTNGLTSAASAAGYKQVPFRISEVLCHYTQKSSDVPRTEYTTASISE